MDIVNQIKDRILSYFSQAIGEESKTYKIISERMQKLQIEVLDNENFVAYYKERMGKRGRAPAGFYDPLNKKVVLKNANLELFQTLETVIHETVHALSDNGIDKVGLTQYNEGLGRGFNEMATCYITSKILGEGYGGGYSQDHREIFKMFLRTTKIKDNELFDIFFQSENWLTQDIKDRFNRHDSESLSKLIRFYDVRSTEEFEKSEVRDIINQSAMINHIQEDEKYRKSLYNYCDYFEIPMPIMQENLTTKLGKETLREQENTQLKNKVEDMLEILEKTLNIQDKLKE